jgi:hypothetical protein
MITRAQWQQLAEDRILDAQAQLEPAAARWSAAYYLVGYAVECGLKACILARLAAHPEVIFADKKFSQDAWTHDIEKLVALADLKALRDADAASNQALKTNWQLVKDWKETARYDRRTQSQAQSLYDAITDPNDGVMTWIKLHW